MKSHRYLSYAILFFLVIALGLGCESGYTIMGMVEDPLGEPVSEVTIDFSNGSDPVITNSSGYWSKSSIIGPVVVTARKFGWSFSPDNYILTEASRADFIGTSNPVSLQGSASKRRTALPGMWFISYLLGDLDFEVRMSPSSMTIPGDGELSASIPDGALITRVSITINITHEAPTEVEIWVTTDGSSSRLDFLEFPVKPMVSTHIWDGLPAQDRVFHIRIHDPVFFNNGKLNDVLVELEWVLL